MQKSLFESLGGFSSVRKIVLEFYNRVLEEEELYPFFKDINMANDES